MAEWANTRERKVGNCRAKCVGQGPRASSSPCSVGPRAGGSVRARLPLWCQGSIGSSCCWGNIPLPSLLLMNIGETCCAMTLISKENCKAFFFFFFSSFPTC